MIFGRHSVLKRGCSTWDPRELPQSEFQGRLDAVRREMSRRDLDALVIYGDNFSFADLCYLTNYFPKVRGGIGVVPRDGALSLLLNIGSRDVPFAKTLTWVEDVRASNQVGADAAKLLKERGYADAKVGLIDSGRGLPLPQWEELRNALPRENWRNGDTIIAPLRLRKNERELAAMHRAGRVLREVCAGAAEVIKPGRREYEIIADIDRLARDKGAEDIRVLAGEQWLNPPSFKHAGLFADHWAVYLAVQHERYWTEAARTHLLTEDPMLLEGYRKAQEVVEAIAKQLMPNTPVAAIDEAARHQLGESYWTASVYGLANGIGLNLWEAPFLNADDALEVGPAEVGAAVLQEHMTLALRVTLALEGKLVMFGDSFEVTAAGGRSLLAGD